VTAGDEEAECRIFWRYFGERSVVVEVGGIATEEMTFEVVDGDNRKAVFFTEIFGMVDALF